MEQSNQTNKQLLTEIEELRTQVSSLEQQHAILQESTNKYKTLFEYAPLCYQSLDDSGHFLDVNSTWLQTLGYKREEVEGEYYGKFLHPDWQSHFDKNFPLFKKRGYVHDVQFKIRHRQGHYLYITFDGCVGYNLDGSFRQTYCVFKDITESIQAEEALQMSEQQYFNLFENAEISIWNEDISGVFEALEKLRLEGVTDLEQYLKEHPDKVHQIANEIKIISVNKATFKLFGAETSDKFLEQITNIFGPGADDIFINELCAIWDDKEFFRSEAAFVAIDGRKIDAIISFYIPKSKEGFKSIPVSIINITELKQAQKALQNSEERFRALSDAAHGGIIIHDQGVILECNTGLSDITGFSYQELINYDGLKLIEPKSLDKVLTNIRSGYEKSYEVEGVRKDGSIYPLAIKGKNIIYKGKEVRVIEFVDITERKLAEVEQARLQRELQQVHKMEALGQLTGGIAHDFNNILGIIQGYTSLTLERYGNEIPDKVEEYLGTVMKASERAKSLVSQMLTFSRNGNPDAEPLQFAPLIKENIEMLHSLLPSSINIDFHYENDLPNILLNTAQLQQLMINLCLNAKDAMEGSGNLTIHLGWNRNVEIECFDCRKRLKGDWIELSVADTGSGMTEDTLKHIFEPFFTTKDVGEGTGMGLSVLHGIISSHGGHVLVETELNKGTTFRLQFPPLVDSVEEISEVQEDSNRLVQGKGKDVLVVDDELGLAEYIGDLLELNGYNCSVMTDSLDALSLFQENPDKFALLVTDQTMPGLTGMDLIKQLREIRAELPVLLCTGYSDIIDKESAESTGIRYMSKPIDAGQFIQSAGELLEG